MRRRTLPSMRSCVSRSCHIGCGSRPAVAAQSSACSGPPDTRWSRQTSLTTARRIRTSTASTSRWSIRRGQFGYNYQFSPIGVLGFEADFQGSGERGSGTFTDPFSSLFCGVFGPSGVCNPGFPAQLPVTGTAMTNYQANIDWFGTVRGRLGFLVGDQLLIYGTGGLAYGRVSVSGSTNASAALITSVGQVIPFTPGTAAFGASGTNVGFSVGGGIEGRLSWLSPNWTWKVEYLYLDLGSLDTAAPFSATFGVESTATGTVTTHTHFTDNIVRAGLNYQFH